MKLRHWILFAVLLMLATATTVGLVRTRDLPPEAAEVTTPTKPGKPGKTEAAKPKKERLVDMKPLLTARSLAPMAATTEEQQMARQAERLANHQVDLAFADAMKQVADNPLPDTPEVKALSAAKDKAEATVEADQKLIQQLTRRLAAAPETQKDDITEQLEVAKAQAELDQDELDEASEDLERAGGDAEVKIRRLKAAKEAAENASQVAAQETAPKPSTFAAASLAGRLHVWRQLRDKVRRLEEARQDALTKAERINTRKETFSAQIKKDSEGRSAAKEQASGFLQGAKAGSRPLEAVREEARSALASLKRHNDQQRRLANYVKRMQDSKDLAELYGAWGQSAALQCRAALHQVIRSLCWIAGILLALFAANRAIAHFLHGGGGERQGRETIRSVAAFAANLLGLLVIVSICFGVPGQLSTILGLAGAGLTVALKDFIVAFFGWFVLMGRNGIRVGDWVEIKGVGGEVVEIGLLRTVVMETGAWSDSGHPTGRRVAFVNSFAVEGHYFNFSTSGQWLWDELKVLIPAGRNPHPVLEGVQALLERETEANAKVAEAEWNAAAKRYRVKTFSARPALNVVPTSEGIEIRARYITRAYERHDTRSALYAAIVELMHGKAKG